ncbi:hypothetical protein KSP39_PZI001108 [Platanthera zijinensis]|uniref:Uncharacterized protein n=1 Tax=Platanthera zijinensis TaxID=2320716 RepID=A0AAP0GFK3_9ASPA
MGCRFLLEPAQLHQILMSRRDIRRCCYNGMIAGISMPIAMPESLKKSKLPMDVFVAPQVRDNEVGPQNTATVQKKSFEHTVPESSSSSTDKDSKRASLMHVNKSESSSFVPTIVGILASSMNEEPKRINKSELKHSKQKALRGNGLASTTKDLPSINSTGFHLAPVAD